MKIRCFVLLASLFGSIYCFSQNRVGIGTANPTAQLHTTGSLRLQGIKADSLINRMIGLDSNGNVFYREIAGFSWQLTGNKGIDESTNFLGTTDNKPLVLRANNFNRMHLSPNGSIRMRPIAHSNLIIRNSPNVQGEDDNIGIDFIRDDASDVSTTNVKARIQFDGYPLNYPDASLLHTAYLRFFTNFNGSLTQRMVITNEGFVAIGRGYTYPLEEAGRVTRPFEVNCEGQPLRFKSLPSGSGNILVIDSNGDIRVSNQGAKMLNTQDSTVEELKHQIELLKKELELLKSKVVSLEERE
ncbi:hypothetical protein [Foetidibacter luteolus]|uniref:hypothetical protein n=1 Tax=Foetidibacter luteolus TaxID=2608880 RepID=UPI001A98D3DB|nr:hypothetical protein [Foetidibacter luteolus]